MKRMSEVFKLPVKTGDGFGCCLLYSEDAPIASFNYEDYSSYAAHAINHVDALADALEAMIDMYCAGNLPNKATLDASSALASYRGDK